MKHPLRVLMLVAALPAPVFADGALAVRLELAPATTLPALPVAMRVSVTNAGAVPVTVASPMSVTMTGSAGASATAVVAVPAAWKPEMSHRGRYTIAPGATLECIAPVDPFLAGNELFLMDEFPLWKPGVWSFTATVFTTDGASATSNAEKLTVTTPTGDDAAIWQRLSNGGEQPFSSQRLLELFDVVLAKYPASGYYRHVAPFALNLHERDDDRYAAQVLGAVADLPPPYVDGARIAIAQRYLDHGDRVHAREYACPLARHPSSAMSAIIGEALLRAATR